MDIHYFANFITDSKWEVSNLAKIKRDNARAEKWRNMMSTLPQMISKKDIKCNQALSHHFTSLVKERIRKGVPESFSGQVWPWLAKVQELKARSNLDYDVKISSFFGFEYSFYKRIFLNKKLPTKKISSKTCIERSQLTPFSIQMDLDNKALQMS